MRLGDYLAALSGQGGGGRNAGPFRYDPSRGDRADAFTQGPYAYDPGAWARTDGFMDAGPTPLAAGIVATAQALGMHPLDVATIVSYETGGTFDPMQSGPTTQWGQHRGFIQFGEPQAQQYGADFSSPETAMASQLGPEGAIVRYMLDRGFRPGMSLLDAYSTINAGAPGRYDASDANNGGAPGTVADKVNEQFGPHRENAERLLAGLGLPGQSAPPAGPASQGYPGSYVPPPSSGGNAFAGYAPEPQAPPPPAFGGNALDVAAFMRPPRPANAMAGFVPGTSPFIPMRA